MPAGRPAGVQARRRTMKLVGAASLRVVSGWKPAVPDASRQAPRDWEPRRRRGLWATWLMTALLHTGLIVAWLHQPGPPVARQVPRIEVRIVPLPPPPPGAATEAPRLQPPLAQPATDLPAFRKPAARPSQPAAITLPGDPRPPDSPPSQLPSLNSAGIADPLPGPALAQQDPPTPPAPSPGKSALRLNWAPPSRPTHPASAPTVREQALNDARSNTQRTTAEARMAQSVGDDRLQEEVLGDGRRRIRKDAACADVHRTHIAQLNPFDARLRDLHVAKPCD
jgi:hypothetical protein